MVKSALAPTLPWALRIKGFLALRFAQSLLRLACSRRIISFIWVSHYRVKKNTLLSLVALRFNSHIHSHDWKQYTAALDIRQRFKQWVQSQQSNALGSARAELRKFLPPQGWQFHHLVCFCDWNKAWIMSCIVPARLWRMYLGLPRPGSGPGGWWTETSARWPPSPPCQHDLMVFCKTETRYACDTMTSPKHWTRDTMANVLAACLST